MAKQNSEKTAKKNKHSNRGLIKVKSTLFFYRFFINFKVSSKSFFKCFDEKERDRFRQLIATCMNENKRNTIMVNQDAYQNLSSSRDDNNLKMFRHKVSILFLKFD